MGARSDNRGRRKFDRTTLDHETQSRGKERGALDETLDLRITGPTRADIEARSNVGKRLREIGAVRA